ncbi:glycoside hydrolase family 68 protein [Rathayibacter rathayi]|nr:glycoside hydrolase family 68 protein [Rathayibacter rathayi]
MSKEMRERRPRRSLLVICACSALFASVFAGGGPGAAAESLQKGPQPTVHSQQAFAPEDNFTSKWTRADARQIKRLSDPSAPPRENSMPASLTMPTVPQDFPDMSNGKVWVWDTWPLADDNGNQYSVNGWEIIYSLVADRSIRFDDRHTFAKIGYFYRPADLPEAIRPKNGGWTYGGLVFREGVTDQIFADRSFSHQTQWSGSARISKDGEVKLFFTDVAFYRDDAGRDIKPYDSRIVLSVGHVQADAYGVSFSEFDHVQELLNPNGIFYQNAQQNRYYNFRDPFTFKDPAHPDDTYMVFEGNSAFSREEARCTKDDLGYGAGDPFAESVDAVNESGAIYQIGNVGLARAKNKALTEWEFLPPILSANCVTDQTERPQFIFTGGKAYLFTISHRQTFASGMDGPEGVYAFVGNGIRSDFQPLNGGSGLALGNPTNLNFPGGRPYAPSDDQPAGQFEAYSHYVMPGGLVESFIDSVGTSSHFSRGGTLAPTVKIEVTGVNSTVDYSYGNNGLGQWADIPANMHLFTLGGRSWIISEEDLEQIRSSIGSQLEDYFQGKPVAPDVREAIERFIAEHCR